MIVGNDVSAIGQGQIDFDTYKKNSNFVLVKASEGTGFRDPQLTRSQSEARRVGLPLGYYHFARPEKGNDPVAEADYFLAQVGNILPGEVLALDFEVAFADAVNWCKSFLDHVAQKTGIKPLIYMDNSRRTGYKWQSIVDAGYGLWLADYSGDPNKSQFPPDPWSFVAIQQWTNSQQVPGISRITDGDAFFGDVNAFKKYGKPAPTPPPTPTPTPPMPPVITDDTVIPQLGNKTVAQIKQELTDIGNQLLAASEKISKVKQDLA